MSLHVLANHMATKGRGSDSMLVHMTPEEVASLQALAMKNGGSLTINPDTGLPEAGFLKKLLPMIAGFALGPAGFGLMSAAGAGLAVGGVTALATGSLSKGLMAGLGAYGGAGLGEAFMGAGANAVGAQSANLATSLTDAQAQALGFQNAATAPAANAAATSNLDKIGAGFKAVTDSPSALGQFAKDNWKVGLAAASPFIADAMVPTTTKMPAATPGYIRPFQYDANTRTVRAMDPVLASEWGARQFPDFIRKTESTAPSAPPAGLGQQLPPGMASGGIVALAEGGETDPYARFNTMSGQSKAAYDYLMGNTAGSTPAGLPAIAPRPVVSNTNPPATTTTTTPSTSMTTTPVTGGGGGGGIGGGGGGGGGASVGNAGSDTDPSPTYSGFVPEPANPNIPVVDLTPSPVTPSPDADFPSTYPQPLPQGDPYDQPYTLPQGDPYDQPYTPPQGDPYDQPYTLPQGDPYDQPYTLPQGDPYDQPYTPPQGDPYDQPYIPDPEPVDPNFFEPGYGNTGVPEPVPYQGDPYDQPYTPPQGDPYDQPYDNSDYEVQPWENVNNPGTDSMAGDNSFNSDKNTYTGETDSVQQQGLPDAFGSYPGEPTYIDDNGGAGSFGGRMIDAEGDDGFGDEDYYDYQGNANGGLMGYANGGMMPRYALGGLGALGGYSDGGRLLKGPGDGVSDSIPATIGNKKQPARLADGEFVVPARIVSELGNGSTEAGARKLYAMMDRIQKARGKTVGKGKVAANSRSDKHLPA
jgi:hypothetical protein